MVASLWWRFLDYVVWTTASCSIGWDFFQMPRGFLNLLAGNSIFFTEISDYGPYATCYHTHPFVAIAVGPWTAPLPPWVAFYVFVGVSLGLLLLGGRLLASVFPDPTGKAFSYFAMFFGLPVYALLWNGQIHVLVNLAVVLILAGLMRCEQDPSSADRYLRWLQLGLLISLLSKPLVLLMLPVFFAVPEIRRKLLLPIGVYAAVSLLFLLLPRLNPGGYNGIHWLYMLSGSLSVRPPDSFLFPAPLDYTQNPWIYSFPMLLYRTCGGATILPAAKLPLAAIAVMSAAPFFLPERSQRLRAATVTVALCILSYVLSYCIVFEFNYTTLLPVLPVMLWLRRQESSPWLRRLLMGSLLVSLVVFLPTTALLERQHLDRAWVHGAVQRVMPVLAAFLGLFVYGIVFSWRAWRGQAPAAERTPHGVWASLYLGGVFGTLFGGVLAAVYLTLPGRLLMSPSEWTRNDWTTHLEDVISRPGVAPEELANIHQALGRWYTPADPRIALEHYRKAAAFESHSAQVRVDLGNAFFALGHFDEAAQQYQEAMELDPRSAKVHNCLAAALVAQGRVGDAMEHLRRAIELNPEFADPHYNLGVALMGRGRVDEAIAHYQRALAIKPEYADAHNNLRARAGGPRTG